MYAITLEIGFGVPLMSLIIDASTTPPASNTAAGSTRPSSRVGMWMRVVLAVVLIGASAGVRIWQQGRYDEVLRSGQASPFPLAEVPLELGVWKGIDDQLDPDIASGTGAVDAIFRTYTNQQTGVKVSLILLYGPATEVFIHAPEVCYTASGYDTLLGPDTRSVAFQGRDAKAPFYAHTFGRGEGGYREIQRVICSWFFNGKWSPVQANFKVMERVPGMYKLHLARGASPTERFDGSTPEPCEELAALILPEVQKRLEATGLVGG